MDIKKAKELSTDAIYEINQLVTLIDEQTDEIVYLEDKIVDLKEQVDDLTESSSPNSPTEEVAFDGEHDFYEK